MSSSSDFPLPTPAFYAYVLSQRTDTRTAHEKNVARFDALHIRHLSPFPDAFLPRCRLTPSFPLHPVRFTNSAHVALANDEKQFFDLTHLSFTEFTLLHTYLYNTLLTSHKHSNSTSAHLHTMPTHLTASDQLLLWLFHLRGDRTSQLVMHFDYLHRSTLLRYIDHVAQLYFVADISREGSVVRKDEYPSACDCSAGWHPLSHTGTRTVE